MIYQVYFKDEQRGVLEPQFTPYNNANSLTPYFENSVILQLINKKSDPDEYFGVLSWNLRAKIERMKKYPHPFTNYSSGSYSFNWLLEEIEKNNDVIFLMGHEPQNPISAATKIHPRFEEHWNEIMNALGLSTDVTMWSHLIYCNFFIAKHSVYKRYVDELLAPAMRVMDKMPSLWEDSNYPMPVTPEVKRGLGLNHYPYHAFICERLFSYWYNFMYKKN